MADVLTIQVTDSLLNTAIGLFSIPIVTPASPVITTTSPLTDATQFIAYTFTMAATSGTPPYTWSLSSQTGSNGWSISSAGVVSGTATVLETDVLQIVVTDALSNFATGPFNITVDAPPALVALWPDPLPDATLNVPYSFTLTATGGVPPYTFGITAGALPTGMSLVGAVVQGTPTVTVTLDAVTFSVTDSSP